MSNQKQPMISYGTKKLLGAYPQRQEGLFMQRIPLLGGRIEAAQLRHIARLARVYAGGAPLHITTRQDIELHNIAEAHAATVQANLAMIGISTYGAGGDSVRNITVCPCCAFDPSAVDVMPLAQQVRDAILAAADKLDLPRKFKISFSGCKGGGARLYLQDLGFVALTPESIRVVGAGSLGPRPQTGIVLVESIAPDDVMPLIWAALEVFAEHGDRDNRRTARLRHIRQRVGDAVFKTMLEDAFHKQKALAVRPPVRLRNGQGGFEKRFTLQTLGGKLTCAQAMLLADMAENESVYLRINLWHGIDLYSRSPFDLPEELRLLTGRPRIIACPGSSTCKNGLTDCRAAAEAMAEVLSRTGKMNLTVGISGCANHCALSAVCDVGLAGRQRTIDGVRQEAYDIYLSGGNGADERLAERKETVAATELTRYFEALE
jgi:sulfite reductase beta subunit-like hemoprotein